MYKVITAAATPVLTAAEFKAQARYESSDTSQDAVIERKIAAATIVIERHCHVAMVEQTVETRFPCFAEYLPLECVPYRSGITVQYQDADDTTQSLAASAFDLDDYSAPMRLKIFNQPTISIESKAQPVVVTYVAGYGTTAADVPAPLVEAVLIVATHWEAYRSNPEKVLMMVDYLIDPYRQDYARV